MSNIFLFFLDFKVHKIVNFFKLLQEMEYAHGASAYALSNASILLCSCLLGSLEVLYFTRLEYQKKLETAIFLQDF